MHRRRLLAMATVWPLGARAASDALPTTLLDPWGARPTPALAAQTLDGRAVTLADFAGRPLLLNFWASWCAPCVLEMPALDRLRERFAGHGLQVAAVNHGETPERVRRFLAATPFGGTVLLDRSQRQLAVWGAQALPASMLVDRQGRARLWGVGERVWAGAGIVGQVEVIVRAQRLSLS